MRSRSQFALSAAVLVLLPLAGAHADDSDVRYDDPVLPVHFPVSDATLVPVAEANLSSQTREAMQRLQKAIADHPAMSNLPPARRREIQDRIFMPFGLPDAPIARVEERFIPGPGDYKIRVRIYSPLPQPAGPLPVIAYYHGGGMMVGSLEQYQPIARRLCQKSGAVVVTVDYRMSPEYKFPTAIDDSYAALQWIAENAPSFGGNPNKLAVAGDSAGGQIAAVMAQMARDRSGPKLSYQALIYPAVGTRGESRSLDAFGQGYVFSRSELEWAYGSWIGSLNDLRDPRVMPILARDFSNLPAAYVLSAEYEIMRDDIEQYAHLLKAAGVQTVLHRFPGTVHPFLSMAGVIDAGKDAIDETAAMLRAGLGLPTD